MARVLTDNQIETAKMNGIPYRILYKRVAEYGWSVEKAIQEPVGNKFGNKQSQFTKEELEIARSNGVSYSALCNRVNNYGWTKEKALTTKPIPLNQRPYYKKAIRTSY